MAYPYSVHKTYVSGEILTASDLNSTDVTHINNNIPESTDDYSANVAEMQSTADPYPASSESLATTLAGEIERLRHLIAQITGETYWYYDPDTDLTILGKVATVVGTSNTQILAPSGTDSAPGYAFSGDAATGLWKGASSINLTYNGSNKFQVTSTIIQSLAAHTFVSGTDSAPGIAFAGDTNTGIYRSSDGVMNYVSNGNEMMQMSATQVQSLAPHRFLDGSASIPSISFSSDQNTGLFRSAENEIAVSLGASRLYTFGTAQFDVLGTLNASEFIFKISGSQKVEIDSSGRILVGVTASQTGALVQSNGASVDAQFNAFSINSHPSSDRGWRILSGKNADSEWGNYSFRIHPYNGANTGDYVISHGAGEFRVGSGHCGTEDATTAFVENLRVDSDATSGNTRLLIYDVDNATLERVSVGTADSGGAGYKFLRIPN